MAETEISQMRATAHPVRLQILSLLTGAEMSAAEVARELELTHANASYHLRLLASAGLLVVAGEEKIRGGVAKRYRHPWEAVVGQDTKPTEAETARYMRVLAEEMVRRYARKQPGTRALTTDAEMWVTPEVWTQVVTLVEQASHLVHAEAQPPRTPGTLHVDMTAALFEMDSR